MQEITLQLSLSQKVYVTLGGQNCAIKLHQRSTGFYADIYVDENPIAQGVLCLNCTKIVRYPYLGFSGDLVFVDTKGASDPVYGEIGTRFRLYYITSDEVAQ